MHDSEAKDQLSSSSYAFCTAYIEFRRSARRVADEFLKAQKANLVNSRIRMRMIRDRQAYEEGKEGSKNIDFKGKRVEEPKGATTFESEAMSKALELYT